MICATRAVAPTRLVAPVKADRGVEIIAAKQAGAFHEKQARALGLSRFALARRLASGQYREIHPSTYALAGTPSSWLQQLWGAQLWAGEDAVLSHRSAGALHGLEGIPSGFVELTSPRRIESKGVILHRKRLHANDVEAKSGLRLTRPGRTILDLGDVLRFRVVEQALDDALHRGLTSLTGLDGLLARAGGRGVRGTAMVRDLVKSRDPSALLSQSTLERRLVRIIRTSGLPSPVPQYEVFDEDGFVARVDFAYPDLRLAIEADGYRFHRDKQKWGHDLSRRTALARLGWRVLHFTWEDIHDRPGWVVEQIRRSLELDERPALT